MHCAAPIYRIIRSEIVYTLRAHYAHRNCIIHLEIVLCTQRSFITIDIVLFTQREIMLQPLTLSTILPFTGQNKRYGNILLYVTFVISVLVSHFDYKHSRLIDKNVPIAFILPSRWPDGAESLGIGQTSCLCSSACSYPFKIKTNWFLSRLGFTYIS